MKKLLFIASLLVGSLAVNAQEQKADDVIKVKTETYNFGKLKQNVPVTTYFEITNKSNKPIVIENAWGSCGCTTPEVPKEPIAPKATVKLKVGYNAAALSTFNKDIFVKLAGVTEPKVLKITGEVLDEATYNAQVKDTQKPSDTKSTDATKSTKGKAAKSGK
jgi:hypothetical protein